MDRKTDIYHAAGRLTDQELEATLSDENRELLHIFGIDAEPNATIKTREILDKLEERLEDTNETAYYYEAVPNEGTNGYTVDFWMRQSDGSVWHKRNTIEKCGWYGYANDVIGHMAERKGWTETSDELKRKHRFRVSTSPLHKRLNEEDIENLEKLGIRNLESDTIGKALDALEYMGYRVAIDFNQRSKTVVVTRETDQVVLSSVTIATADIYKKVVTDRTDAADIYRIAIAECANDRGWMRKRR